jgi:hypothetical protein
LDADEVRTRRLNRTESQSLGDVWLDVESPKEPGVYRLLVRLEDRVGHRSEVEAVLLQWNAPRPVAEKEKPKGPTRGPITGTVAKGTYKPPGVTVTLEGPTVKATKTDNQGAFRFDDVEAGTYTLKASGAVQNITRSGELKGVQHAPPDKPAKDQVITLN